MNVFQIDNVSSYRMGRLNENLTVDNINQTLKFASNSEESSDGKVTHEWQFSADEHECAIWDYKGTRWSFYGPSEVFVKLFGRHV